MKLLVHRSIIWLISLVMAIPFVALLGTCFIEGGVKQAPRLTALPAALAVSDPFVWVCLGNSAVCALVTALLARVVGVYLACAIGRWRFWGRGLFDKLAFAGLAASPLFLVLGLLPVGEECRRVAGDVIERYAQRTPWSAESLRQLIADSWGWLMLIAVGVAWGAPMVARSALGALRNIDGAWEEAALAAGAKESQVWKTIVWPLMRPSVARSVASVFLFMFVEPGSVLVLGLRRTLAFQIVQTALESPHVPGWGSRCAVLAVCALTVGIAVRVLANWWGGGGGGGGGGNESRPNLTIVRQRHRNAGPLRTCGLAMGLAVWSVAACTPLLGLALAAARQLPRFDEPAGSSDRLVVLSHTLRSLFATEHFRNTVTNSVYAGIFLVFMCRIIGPVLASNRRSYAVGLVSMVPPLCLGVAVFQIPRMLLIGANGSIPQIRPYFQPVATAIENFPTIGLVLALTMLQIPWYAAAASALGSTEHGPRIDAGRVLGMSRRAARGMSKSRRGRSWSGVCALVFAAAMTNVAPALVLCARFGSRTIGPDVLELASGLSGDQDLASLVACAAIVINSLALAWAWRSKAPPIDGSLRT